MVRCPCRGGPGQDEIDSVAEKMVSWLMVLGHILPEDFLTWTHFRRCLEDINMDASPGLPYCRAFNTNRKLLKRSDGTFNEENVNLVWSNVQYNLANRKSDPIRVFIKDEPISPAKMEAGRYRLILAPSIVDQIIDAMLFSAFNKKAIEHFLEIPIMVGWSPLYGGHQYVPPEWYGYDCSAWDWTVPGWFFDVFKIVRKSLCMFDERTPYGLWSELVDFRYQELYEKPTIQLSCGLKFHQNFTGLMKSGCFNTITDNSLGQMLLEVYSAYACGLEPDRDLLIMGDDSMKRLPYSTQQLEVVREIGIKLKPPEVGTFCGMRFLKGGVVEPLYVSKHMCRLLHCSDSTLEQMILSYQLLYFKSDRLRRICELGKKLGVRLLTLSELSSIYDGDC